MTSVYTHPLSTTLIGLQGHGGEEEGADHTAVAAACVASLAAVLCADVADVGAAEHRAASLLLARLVVRPAARPAS